MKALLQQIQHQLKLQADGGRLDSYKKFIPGSTFKAYGVPTPALNLLAQQFKTGGFELVQQLWDAGAFEEQLLAVKILGKIAKKDPELSLQLVQHFAPAINNWAVCDAIGMQALKPIVKTHQKEIFALAKKYNRSKNFWERRLSLVLVEWYTRDKQYHEEINKLIAALQNDKEYYVRKAIVWINKNFKKGK